MIKNFFYKLKGLFKLSEKENIKEVLEDLIEEDVNEDINERDYIKMEESYKFTGNNPYKDYIHR